MLETLKERKEALEARGVKGFTLMEMLIVIAIIAVLIAIAIPLFTGQLDNAKHAANEANARDVYAVIMADYMDNGKYDNGYSVASDFSKITVTTQTGTGDSATTETQTFNFQGTTALSIADGDSSVTLPTTAGTGTTAKMSPKVSFTDMVGTVSFPQ